MAGKRKSNSTIASENTGVLNYGKYRVPNAVVNYYLVLMFTAFPLFYTNGFSNIRHDKYYLFLVLSAVVIVVGFTALISNFLSGEKSGDKWYKTLSVTDIALGAFVLICIISTLFSSYSFSCISGEQGRNVGLIFILTAFSVYLIVSRFYIPKDYVFFFAAGGCFVVFILGILNFYYIDPLSIFAGYGEEVIKDFISTIGNKNIMSAFCCLTIPLTLMLFLNTDNRALRYVCLISCAAGFPAMLCSDSESGFLGLIPLLALILIYYSRSAVMLRRFFAAVCAMLICAKLVSVLSLFTSNKDKGFGTMQRIFIHGNLSYVLIICAVVITVLLYVLERKIGESALPKAVPITFSAVFVLVFLTLIGMFINFSFIDTETKLGGIMTFFRFNEKWGTHRGYMWIKSWEIFKTGGIKNALIGNGPDSFYYAFSPYFAELSEKFNNSTNNCAHNEFLNYLITTGITGLAAYITFTVSAVVRAVKAAKINYLPIVFAAPVLCYLMQSTVNISNPIVTPFLFIFIGLSEAVVRKIK